MPHKDLAVRKEYQEKYRATAGGKVAHDAANRRYRNTEKGKTKHTATNGRWIKRNPEKRQAHKAVYHAKRNGELISQPCAVCGSEAEAHHPDYSKPLEVVWLCHCHHIDAHMKAKEHEGK
jgi:hypothetical protein